MDVNCTNLKCFVSELTTRKSNSQDFQFMALQNLELSRFEIVQASFYVSMVSLPVLKIPTKW